MFIKVTFYQRNLAFSIKLNNISSSYQQLESSDILVFYSNVEGCLVLQVPLLCLGLEPTHELQPGTRQAQLHLVPNVQQEVQR